MPIVLANFESDLALGDGGAGWELGWGSELIFQHILPHVDIGDSVLDICSGTGRASHCFGIKGCEVTLLDHSDSVLEEAVKRADILGYKAKPLAIKAESIERLTDRFKAVLILEGMVHQTKTQATTLLSRAAALLEKGGYLYADAPSSVDSIYTLFCNKKELDRDTYEDWCGCSGEYKLEPHCFFHPGELALVLCHLGLDVIYQASDVLEWQTRKTIAIARKP